MFYASADSMARPGWKVVDLSRISADRQRLPSPRPTRLAGNAGRFTRACHRQRGCSAGVLPAAHGGEHADRIFQLLAAVLLGRLLDGWFATAQKRVGQQLLLHG